MRIVNINIGDESVYVCSNIIGRVGEHNATRLNFILSPAFLGYQYFLTLEAEGAQPVHTDTLTESDGVVCYTIPFQFLVKGVLLIELSAFDEDRIIKSAIVSFEVPQGLEAGEEVPSEPYTPTWYVKVFDEANRAEQEADKAQNSAISAQSAKDEAEAAKTAAQTTLQTLEDGIANGDFKGDPGQDGVDGKDGNDGVDGTNATTTAVATGTTNGLMSSTDKAYLDGLPANLNAKADKDNLITAFTYTPNQVTLPNYPSTDGSPIMTCTAHGLSLIHI